MFPTRLAKYAALLLGGSTLALLFGTHFRIAAPPPLPEMSAVPPAAGLPEARQAPSLAIQRVPEGHVVASPGTGDARRAEAMIVYKWVDDAGEWHFSNTPPKGVEGAITQEVVVSNLVTAEHSALLAGVDPERPREPAARAPDPGPEAGHPLSPADTRERLGGLMRPVTEAVKPVTDALGPVVDAYKEAPELVERAHDVAAKMEQRNQALQQMEEMIQ